MPDITSKYLLDENLSRRLIDRMHGILPITHVSSEGLLNASDTEIWHFAKNEGYTIITKDFDFSDMSRLFGCPPKVIKLNCGNQTTNYIGTLLNQNKISIIDFAQGEHCYMEIF